MACSILAPVAAVVERRQNIAANAADLTRRAALHSDEEIEQRGTLQEEVRRVSFTCCSG